MKSSALGADRGSALVSVTFWLVITAVSLLLIVGAAQRIGLRSQAQAAADAAALAGAADGESAASRFAQINGATLTGFVTSGDVVTVTVEVDGVVALASAEQVLVPGVSRTGP